MDCLLGLSGDLRGFFVDNVEIIDGGERGDGNPCSVLVWQMLSTWSGSLTLSPRALEVSPMYDELHPSALHSQ